MPREIGPNTGIPTSREANANPEQRRADFDNESEQLWAPENTSEQFKNDLHSASNDFNQSIGVDPKELPKTGNEPARGIWKFLEKFLQDKWPIRKGFALGNEMAESFKGLLFNWLPKPLAWAIHKALWSLAILATGGRVAANAKFAPKPEDKTKAGAKMLMHDGIAAIGLPTLWVNYVTDPLQDKLYKAIKLPEKVADVVRSAVSLISCYFVISTLDEPAKKVSAWALKYSEDHHKEVNQQS